jgi:aspartyl-tRNA(Asn)/glutamyl-tRNA(Gln) amidotransferase subunit B
LVHCIYMSRIYYPVIGLEIHAELKTASKMFCSCPNDPFHAPGPNSYVCPVCMAHPGALPTPNKAAIASVIQMGLAINGTIADYSEFDRKNYFYPDIPKGYQISQHKYPIVTGGSVAGFAVTRVHLEEDTATSEHQSDRTLIDFNRAGVPLMELVTEPVLHSSDDAMYFGRELQLLLRYLNISDANMEMGQMRVEVNISISPDSKVFGTKVEIKNLNSFSVAGKAIDYEISRMRELYEQGRESEIVQETRGWDDARGVTKSQRVKENSEQYRYFPDPDIPKLQLYTLFDIEKLRIELPETPSQRRERYTAMYAIKSEDREFFLYNTVFGDLFEQSITGLDDTAAQLLANYIISDVSGLCGEFGQTLVLGHITTKHLIDIVTMIQLGELGSRGAKDTLRILAMQNGDVREIAEANGFVQKNDTAVLQGFIDTVLAEHTGIVAEYKSGKVSVKMFLLGQIMKVSKGSANPGLITPMLEKSLE